MFKISYTTDALQALDKLGDLFETGQVTGADFESFRSEMETFIKINEELAIEKNIKISNAVDFLKLVASNHYTKSKNTEVIKLKNLIKDAIEKLRLR